MNNVLWQNFAAQYKLSPEQLQQFEKYYELLISWNQNINLTAITEESDVIAYHFEDSLQLSNFYDMASCSMIADIGTGAGLPGIPLKIMFPHLSVVLVEVVQKKVTFLREVIKELGLTNIEVCDFDWRNFLRKTEHPVDLVCARASLRPDELIHMFKPSSPYRNAQLVYWASTDYEVGEKEQPFFVRADSYAVGAKKRNYCFFADRK